MKAFALPILILLLGACAGKAPERHEYLLRAPVLSAVEGGEPTIRLLPVAIAPYLDQQGIVLQMSGTEVRVAGLNRWAEPLGDSLTRYLQVAIANASGAVVEVSPLVTDAAATEILIRVQELHGSAAGTVRLVAEWSVAPPSGERILHTFDDSLIQDADGYAALVSAHAVLLDRLAGAVAASLDSN